MLFIPAASNDNHPVPAIIEEQELYFNLCIISHMFTQDPETCTTWDIHQADQLNMHDINRGMHNALKVPISVVSEADIMRSKNCCEGQWSHQVPHATWGNLVNKGKYLRVYYRELHSQPDLKMPCHPSVK